MRIEPYVLTFEGFNSTEDAVDAIELEAFNHYELSLAWQEVITEHWKTLVDQKFTVVKVEENCLYYFDGDGEEFVDAIWLMDEYGNEYIYEEVA